MGASLVNWMLRCWFSWGGQANPEAWDRSYYQRMIIDLAKDHEPNGRETWAPGWSVQANCETQT